MIKRFFIRLFSIILCVGILAGGAYLSYTSSDFAGMEKDINVILNEAPIFPGFNLEDFQQPEENPEENPEETPEETPEQTPEDNTEQTPEENPENNETNE